MTLRRRFSPLTMLLMSINGTIGSAWLFAPYYAAKIAGPAAIIAWVIGGLATALIALTFAEVCVMFPMAGGTAQIPKISHGMVTSFAMTWVAWLAALSLAPVEVEAILQYASGYFTSLMHMQGGEPALTYMGIFWAAVLMLAFCTLNIIGYKALVRTNTLFFTFKVSLILIASACLMHNQFQWGNFSFGQAQLSRVDHWQAIMSAVAAGGIAFAFTGFKHGVEMAGEVTRSSLAIPLAIVGSVLACLAIYLVLQVAFIGAVQPGMVAHGWQQLQFVGDVGPLAGLAGALGLTGLVTMLFIGAMAAPTGSALISVATTARILYAMAKIGYLPRGLSKLNSEGFPFVAVLVNVCIGLFLLTLMSSWQNMMNFLIAGMVISYSMGPIALLCLREELPDQQRDFKLPAARVLCLLAFYACNLFSYWTGWQTISKLAIAICIGVIIFSLACMRGDVEMKAMGFRSAKWLVPYLLGLVTISYLGAFGGHHVIPFGWDFLVIGLFSTIILYLAVRNRATFSLNEPASAQVLKEASLFNQ